MKWPNGEIATEEEVTEAYRNGLISDNEYAKILLNLNSKKDKEVKNHE